MAHFTGCLVCGAEIVYHQESIEKSCVLCGKTAKTTCTCAEGHYICDACHGLDAMSWIESVCNASESTDPIELATQMMHNEKLKMHGPEHHYLVPAVLLTAYYNAIGDPKQKKIKLAKAKERAKNVLGGFCGFYGSCGAAVGTGIFMSLLTDATPLTEESWGLCNRMTANSLMTLSNVGGPRCCKRTTYLTVLEAIKMVEQVKQVKLGTGVPIVCTFSAHNQECLHEACPFFPKAAV